MTEESRSTAEWADMRARHHNGDAQIRALSRHAREFADDCSGMNFDAPMLSTITARTLIVHGDRDPLYPVELAVELYRAIPNARRGPELRARPDLGEQAAPFVRTATAFLGAPKAPLST